MMSQLSQLRRFKVFPQHKHNMHPDSLYVVQLKSSIFDIVPSPRHLGKDISYRSIVKVDMSSDGIGKRLAKNEGELSATLRQIRDVCHWKGEIVFQELIPGVKEVPDSNFICTNRGNYFGSAQLREFTLPIQKYLQERGYFGLVSFEVLIINHGKYLVDLSPRISGDATHLLLAGFMALDIGLKRSATFCYNKHRTAAKKLVEKAKAKE